MVWYEGNRSLSSTRNLDFKRYTPRPKKLLRASLKSQRTGRCSTLLLWVTCEGQIIAGKIVYEKPGFDNDNDNNDNNL